MSEINPTTKILFLALVLFQGLHSIEEYVGELWINFPPARVLCGLISDDLELGFLVINIGLFVVGMLAWLFVVRPGRPYARAFIWFWIVLEFINGVGHPVWSIMEGGYTPGIATAPFLLVLSILLFRQMRKIITGSK